jgi:hypothetical protein
MDNRLIQSLWIGKTLSIIERLSISSFLKNGHDFHLYTYEKIDNIPEGTVICDAREICEFDTNVMTKNGFGKASYAPFADIFRLQLLLQKGGWWVDLDVVCLKPFFDLPEVAIATSWEIPEGDMANSNVLSFPAGHWFPKECLRHWDTYDREKIYHGLGPDIVKRVVSERNAYSFLLPHDVFNPISWRHVRYLIQKEEPIWTAIGLKRLLGLAEPVGKISDNSRAIHLWNEGWRQGGYDKNAIYSKDSIFEILKQRYL